MFSKDCFLKVINPFPNKPCFFSVSAVQVFEKGEIAHNEHFLLFPLRFIPFARIFYYFSQIYNCRLQTLSVWKSKICHFGKG